MKRNSQLSRALHALLHMARQPGAVTSETIAGYMGTNPVVARRLLAGLRDAGFVRSEKGHGGGWMITCDFEVVTLRDIYLAIGSPMPFALVNPTESPGCVIERIVNEALDEAFHDATALLINRFGSIPLARLSAEFDQRMADQLKRRGRERRRGHEAKHHAKHYAKHETHHDAV